MKLKAAMEGGPLQGYKQHTALLRQTQMDTYVSMPALENISLGCLGFAVA